jgi:hypothetical protein
MSFNNIKKNLEKIIKNFTKDQKIINISKNYIIILKVLSALELVIEYNKSNILDNELITYINIINNEIEDDLKINYDFNKQNDEEHKVEMHSDDTTHVSQNTNNSANGSNSSSSTYCNMPIKKQIEDMLESDSKVIEEISSQTDFFLNPKLRDAYGEITKDMLKDADVLFSKFDRNQDGYITPCDVDKILILMDNDLLSFNTNVIMNMVIFFVFRSMKIDFNEFVLSFAYI